MLWGIGLLLLLVLSSRPALAMTDSNDDHSPANDGGGGRVVPITLTSYDPFTSNLTPAQRRMEGGTDDRAGHPLHSLEDHLQDPDNHPYVSLSGDPTLFPYGLRASIPSINSSAIFRIVDTGSHFTGPGKKYRNAGYEPIDVCTLAQHNDWSLSTADMIVFDGDVLNKRTGEPL